MLHTIALILLWSLLAIGVVAAVQAAFEARKVEAVLKPLAFACAAVVGLVWIG